MLAIAYHLRAAAWLSICCPHYQSQVLAVSEWGAEGEWAVESVTQAIDELATPDSESSVMTVVHCMSIHGVSSSLSPA